MTMRAEELGRLFRFSVIGVTCAVIYIFGFIILSGVGLNPFLANLSAFTTAVVVQYIGHTLWTFRGSLRDAVQGARFAVAIGLGLLLSTLVSTVIAPFFGWPSWLTGTLVAILLPISNFAAFRFWVYRTNCVVEDHS